ncbi:carboxypeptidase-like regulatory domain-containing protein [Hymenobacter sp. GOD-10R]|uniref:carboxypeptidase-like regulatory domain-containing protein n=1 Tax=Hymenobacter sp. GOD-10R TaxID=3093922 RepID=UPI002D795B1A|nr:carboxypeptidase-like regulatory domain-containing protein [Hymenobacter sp. GOD-10R]WRQ26383.1 carboxypeptidase-like regulatory domain-containing protein [Hymenobacter sp. GOD-10R]
MLYLRCRLACLLVSSLFISPPARAQSFPTGKITTPTGTPVAYTSAGVKGKPFGTVAAADGTFSLSAFAPAAATDTVVVSCVGYQSRKLLVSQLRQQPAVQLYPTATQLQEVMVHSKRPKRTILGHNGSSIFTSLNFYTAKDTVPHDRLGREVGLLMKVKQPVRLESFHLFVFNSDFSFVTFRLTIYAVANGQPQAPLLQKDVIFEVAGRKHGWREVDLRPYAIELAGHQDVVASVQWLQSKNDQPTSKYFGIAAHLSPFHSTFLRDKSQESWQKMGANTSLYFTALAYPG